MPAWGSLAPMSVRCVRLVPLVAAAVLVLAACGSDPEPQFGAGGAEHGQRVTSEPPTNGTAEPASVAGLVTYTSEFGAEEIVQRLSDGLSSAGTANARSGWATPRRGWRRRPPAANGRRVPGRRLVTTTCASRRA